MIENLGRRKNGSESLNQSPEKMKLKQLEGLLGGLQQFPQPKVELEQYPTGPHIASRMLFTNQAENSFGDVSNKVVADFGCGCGTLGVAAALLSAEHVLSIDIDPESLEIASVNAEELELDIDFIRSNVLDLGWRGSVVDTVIMNPPFGTRKKGADLDFLSVALKVASEAVYSLHKTSTRDHVKRTALRDFNARSAEVICELRFDVPKMYKFHKKKEVDIAVDLWRFVPASHQRSTS
ncbi:methyltransferase-like protein 5 isoform X1 [Vigna radiata var. radiata]|uniref:Methyltransferase-like protein 5 n=1 Tax=Vigna radiata var. radiata TaxID=3916 RepID=A0A3Q0F3E7_VIGRR|nr:methyltransferase-like protein 5 isoform X1 [Vigna radiata var. radiata]